MVFSEFVQLPYDDGNDILVRECVFHKLPFSTVSRVKKEPGVVGGCAVIAFEEQRIVNLLFNAAEIVFVLIIAATMMYHKSTSCASGRVFSSFQNLLEPSVSRKYLIYEWCDVLPALKLSYQNRAILLHRIIQFGTIRCTNIHSMLVGVRG